MAVSAIDHRSELLAWHLGPCTLATALVVLLLVAFWKARARKALHSAAQELGYDPSVGPTLEAFALTRRATSCPFARTARLWAPRGDHHACLRAFVARCLRGEALDGFVLEVGMWHGAHIIRFGHAVRDLLTSLGGQQDFSMPGWQFRFEGMTFFVTCFAPCYPASSPRCTVGSSSFVLLQPETSFARRKVCAPHVRPQEPPSVRDRTRAAFVQAGRAYHVPQPGELAASFVVRPLRENDAPHAWWADSEPPELTKAKAEDQDFTLHSFGRRTLLDAHLVNRRSPLDAHLVNRTGRMMQVSKFSVAIENMFGWKGPRLATVGKLSWMLTDLAHRAQLFISDLIYDVGL